MDPTKGKDGQIDGRIMSLRLPPYQSLPPPPRQDTLLEGAAAPYTPLPAHQPKATLVRRLLLEKQNKHKLQQHLNHSNVSTVSYTQD